MTWNGHETWYRVVGELDADSERTPVVICHGGPGAAHDYSEPIADLHRSAAPASSTTSSAAARASTFPTRPPTSGRRSCSRTSSPS